MIASHTLTLKRAEISDIDASQELQNSAGYSETLRRYQGSNQVQPPVSGFPARLGSVSRNRDPIFLARGTVSEWRDPSRGRNCRAPSARAYDLNCAEELVRSHRMSACFFALRQLRMLARLSQRIRQNARHQTVRTSPSLSSSTSQSQRQSHVQQDQSIAYRRAV